MFGGVAFVVLALAYSWVTPLGEAADEAAHLEYVREVAFRYLFLVNPGDDRVAAGSLVRSWAGQGRFMFSTEELVDGLGVSVAAARAALRRLKARGEVATPYRGFHVYVPPEYQSLGCLPPEQFVPELMSRLSVPYYAGLLTAARFHGAAHQQPQQFQVVVPVNRPAIRCGRVVVEFVARHNAARMPTKSINTPRGFLQISSPEATAFDLVGYPEHCGGLDNVATVLAELLDQLDPATIADIAALSPVPWSQRLGYLLELVGGSARTQPLAELVVRRVSETVTLVPGGDLVRLPRDDRWKLAINTHVEPDL